MSLYPSTTLPSCSKPASPSVTLQFWPSFDSLTVCCAPTLSVYVMVTLSAFVGGVKTASPFCLWLATTWSGVAVLELTVTSTSSVDPSW